jgi:hypothetical protein
VVATVSNPAEKKVTHCPIKTSSSVRILFAISSSLNLPPSLACSCRRLSRKSPLVCVSRSLNHHHHHISFIYFGRRRRHYKSWRVSCVGRT